MGGNPNYRAQAVELEGAFGLTGISTQWKVPFGLTYEQGEGYLKPYAAEINKSLAFFKPGQEPDEGLQEFRDEVYGKGWRVPSQACLEACEFQNAFFNEVIALNPELEPLREVCTHPLSIGQAIAGVLSQYNLDDVIYFSRDTSVERYRDEERLQRQKKLEERMGQSLEWVASNETLAKIEVQLDHAVAPRPALRVCLRGAKMEGSS